MICRILKWSADEAEKEASAFEAGMESTSNLHASADHPLVAEFKRSEINFQELLETKISTKGQA